jgi:drug/metabolite transporter superfamily protein YnfA
MELDPYAVPGAAAGAIALTQFVKVFWPTAKTSHIRAVAALSGLLIVGAVQWAVILDGGLSAIVGTVLSGVTAGLASSAAFDVGKAIAAKH